MPTLRTLPAALADAAHADAGYCFAAAGEERCRSYAEIRQIALGVARALADAGIRRGDVVALVLPEAEAFLTALFGASMAGAVPASVYPPAPATDLQRYLQITSAILHSARACAVVTTSELAPWFETLRDSCPSLEHVLLRTDLDAPAREPGCQPALDDIAFVQYTSGSTASPKGVALTHANVAANVAAFGGPSGVDARAGETSVSWLPLNHDMGLVGMALGAMYTRGRCVILPPQAFVKRPAEWLRAITRHRAAISFAPNFAFDLCVRRVKDLSGLDLSSWRVAGCGAEPIHAPTLAAFAEKFAAVGFRETSFLPSYGLAEHVLAATFPPRGRRPRVETLAADELTERRMAVAYEGRGPALSLVSCGSPLPGHRLQITAEDGRALQERQVGEILLNGPSVMLGYYRQESLTAQSVRGGWLHTGDLGYVSGGELFVCGRLKDLIIVHGRKYHPQDLEWAVEGLSGVRRGRVVAFGSSEGGKADRVVIVAEPSGTVAPAALAETIRRRISDTFGLVVDDVALVPSGTVGRTTSGKVQRAATKARWERGELRLESMRG